MNDSSSGWKTPFFQPYPSPASALGNPLQWKRSLPPHLCPLFQSPAEVFNVCLSAAHTGYLVFGSITLPPDTAWTPFLSGGSGSSKNWYRVATTSIQVWPRGTLSVVGGEGHDECSPGPGGGGGGGNAAPWLDPAPPKGLN